jgi:hypothetical protein
MDTRTLIFNVKQEIKKLAEEQPILKRARKSLLPREEFAVIKKQFAPDKDWWDHNSAAGMVRDRKIKITAYLNLYHELRGSDYRHGVRDDNKWWYDRCYNKLKEEVTVFN